MLAENVFESNYDQTTIDRKQTVYDAGSIIYSKHYRSL